MFAKIAPTIAALASLVAAVALGACGSDECTRAVDHKTECLPEDSSTSSTTSGGNMMTEACAGSLLCQSKCVNESTCEQINALDAKYTQCMNDCLSGK